MNSRDYKKFATGEYYHVFNRGVGKSDIFKEDQDYFNFIKRLKLALGFKVKPSKTNIIREGESWIARPLRIKPFENGDYSIISYCLMPNHFHFLIRQNGESSISDLMSKVCTSYAMYFNRKYNRVGNLFQDVFKAVNVDNNDYLVWLSAYVHHNPVVAGLVWDLNGWKWSSYHHFLDIGEEEPGFIDKSIIMEQFNSMDAYQKFMATSFDLIKKKKLDSSLFID